MSHGASTPVLLVTGTIGTGKTVVAAEIGEVLARRGLVAAVVDLDWLGWVCRPENAADIPGAVYSLIVRNLAATWPNLRGAGAERLVLARAVTHRDEVDAIRDALRGVELVVVRLTAAPETIRARLEGRDSGAILEEHLRRAVEFDRLLDEGDIADATVSTDGRAPRDLARDVLVAAGWIDGRVSAS